MDRIVPHAIDVLDPSHQALLDPLDRQRGNQRGAHAAPVLGGPHDNRVLLALAPPEDVPERLRAAGLEVRVFVKHAAVGAHVAALVVLLLADGCDAARRQAGGARADQLGEAAEEFAFRFFDREGELGEEEFLGFCEVLEGVSVLVLVSLLALFLMEKSGVCCVFRTQGRTYSSTADKKDASSV